MSEPENVTGMYEFAKKKNQECWNEFAKRSESGLISCRSIYSNVLGYRFYGADKNYFKYQFPCKIA